MKKITAFLLIICTVFCIGCSNGKKQEVDVAVPVGMQYASSNAAYYNLFVPAEWIIDTASGSSSAYVSELDPTNVSAVRVSVPDPSVTTAELYWEKYKEDFRASFTNFTVISENVKTTLSGKDACKYEYTASLTGTDYRYCSVICVLDGSVYMLTYTSIGESYEANMEDFTSICDNFMIKTGMTE